MIYITSFNNSSPTITPSVDTDCSFIAQLQLVPKYNITTITGIINNIDDLHETIQFYNLSKRGDYPHTKKDAIIKMASDWYKIWRFNMPFSVFLSMHECTIFNDILITIKLQDIVSISGDIPFYPTNNVKRVKRRNRKSIIELTD